MNTGIYVGIHVNTGIYVNMCCGNTCEYRNTCEYVHVRLHVNMGYVNVRTLLHTKTTEIHVRI